MPHAMVRRPAPVRYALALLYVSGAMLVTLASQHFGLANRSAAFLAAILLAGWYAGTGPMLVAMALSTFVFDFFFLPPLYTLGLTWGPDPYLVWFLLFAVLAAWFSAARRHGAELLEQARLELESRVAERTAELRRSEAYLVNGQELSHTGSWARRVGTGEAYWSDEAYRIFGLDPRGPAPSAEEIRRICHPDDRELFERSMASSSPFEIDWRVVRPDGSIRFVHTKGQPVLNEAGETVEVMGVLMDVTDRKQAERALRRARERTLEARFAAMLAERTRLAREIHDTLLQGFTGVGLKLAAVADGLRAQPEIEASLRDVIGLAQRTLEDARRAVWDIRSPSLAGSEFTALVRTTAETCVRGTGLSLACEVDGEPRAVEPEIEAVVLRVVQESLTNAVKHAAARTVRVRCAFGERRLRVTVADDGRGFAVDPDFRAYGGHWGLLGMRERASQVGGKMGVRSASGQGTRVSLLVPYGVRHGPASQGA